MQQFSAPKFPLVGEIHCAQNSQPLRARDAIIQSTTANLIAMQTRFCLIHHPSIWCVDTTFHNRHHSPLKMRTYEYKSTQSRVTPVSIRRARVCVCTFHD